ncbi:hypothetical protein [Aquimarina longa]|uniref:hypothetical protein n=1 Tax=Aquimarina longa TaxID=1080221 RepID=UPI0007845180|nr:hypothetical protein [Aquimarina longa]
MSNTTIFKRLFEVQILHDYFLTTADGISFFDKNRAEKNTLLYKKLEQGIYDVRSLFKIEPIGETKKLLKNYKLLMKQTSLGFIVGIEVNAENKLGEIVFKPRFKLVNTLSLTFSIQSQITSFKSLTNISLRPPLPSIYYLTNKGKTPLNESALPAYTSLPLSNGIQSHQDGVLYEMGALVNLGGTTREAIQYTDGNNPSHWEDTTEKRVISDADSRVLPAIFSYRLKAIQNVTKIECSLLDTDNNEIKKITKTSTQALSDVVLDFTKTNTNTIPSGFYTLKVKINDNQEIKYPIYLNDELYNKNHLAIVDIRMDEQNSAYSLIDNQGFLKTKVNAANEKVAHPIYEIRFKNRRTYWRYNKEGDFSNPEINATALFLNHEPEKLISLQPKALTEALIPFKKGNSSKILPYPKIPSIKIENNKIFSEIFINQSNRIIK